MKISHVINPYATSKKEEAIQNITFESMRRAKAYAKAELTIDLFAISSEKDMQLTVDEFQQLPPLTQSVTAISTFKNKRDLPLLKDILDAAVLNSDADYVVYTNADIGLMPQFYVAVKEIIEQGVDAFIVNRRRVSNRYDSIHQLQQIYSEVGKLHNGYDCFVFKKSLYTQFHLGNICLGIPHIGNTLALNLMCFAQQFRLFTEKHLTFHIGYELVKNWGDKDYLTHNKKEYLKIVKELMPQLHLHNIPGSSLPFFNRHFKWLMNPNLHYPTLCRLDFTQWNAKRYPENDANKRLKGYYEWLQKRVQLDN
jgi:hypothetical protein